MKYINQLQHRHIPYHTRMKDPDVSPTDRIRSVAASGCGPCCVCMVVEALTNHSLSIEDCIAISEACEANYGRGTDMNVLAPVIAEKYQLEYTKTSDLDEAVAHLQKGGQIIAHVCVPEGATIGLFTKGGHYIALISTDGKDFCILDPSYKEGKFDIPERAGRVDTSCAPYLYCDIHTVHAETKPNRVKYHLFARKR
ncbi:MAG: hypothetical protein E7403_05145 [Ruminococcaceae bacterium]|nr:hypothetical protein [Oscillospiraceae bacterium]